MAADQLAAFVEEAKSNTELQEKLKSVTSAEAAIEVAKDSGFSITLEDIQILQSKASEISDQELENASGGTFIVPAFTAALALGGAIHISINLCDQ